ncbi:hypothetical protein K438DRAFT_1896772 [Mycena galopus ATCC 62051]|nr:hypothetical protein K438DRAFT_1896772 [Mycena galopus ATCC 62051]
MKMGGSFSALTTLRIAIDLEEPVEGFEETSGDILADAPHLTCLEAHFWDESGFHPAPFSLPGHQLTRVSSTFGSNTEALAALRQLTNIVDCTFAFTHVEVLPVDHRTIPLPRLRSLALQIDKYNTQVAHAHQKHTSLLDFLETPCLRKLVTYKTANVEEVLGLIARSNCATSLESFYFHSSPVHYNLVPQVLRRMPHLTSLEFGDLDGTLLASVPNFVQAVSNQWLSAMQETHPDGDWPNLHVRIVDAQMEEEHADEVTGMLDARHEDGLFITVAPTTDLSECLYDAFDPW